MDHSTMDHSTMDHSTMDHSAMNQSTVDHSTMDHSKMDHSNMSSTGGHDMSGMSGHSMMAMGTFHWGTTGDGIWIESWVPSSEGAYIGACFGLFFFALLSRGLPGLEAYFVRWKAMRDNKIESNVLTSQPVKKNDIEKSASNSDDFSASFNPNAYPNALKAPSVPPFSWSTDTVRSFISAFTTFISYLLMMVVMTGNAGFFFVILGGVFFGELAFGRFKALGGFPDDHC